MSSFRPDGHRVAVVGATGAVGTEMVRVLHDRSYPVKELRLLASARAWPGARPQLVEEAALLIAGFGPPADAARILAQALADDLEADPGLPIHVPGEEDFAVVVGR